VWGVRKGFLGGGAFWAGGPKNARGCQEFYLLFLEDHYFVLVGDTSDRRWPIYRSGTSTKDTGFTECTILITASLPGEQRSANDNNRGGSDLRIRATVLQGNPRKRQEVTSFDLSDDLQPTQNGCLFS